MVFTRNKWFDSFDIERLGLDRSEAISTRQIGIDDADLTEFLFSNEYLEKMMVLSEEELKREESRKALKYLAETDWYAIRELETGIKIPETVKRDRERARAKVIVNG